jgi:hypothetical protein
MLVLAGIASIALGVMLALFPGSARCSRLTSIRTD